MSGVDRVRRELEESIEIALLSTPVDVIIMGPGLTETSPAATLRREIISAAAEYGAVIKPEHDQLVAAASVKLGDGHSLTAYEMHLVGVCDLVVLIPASPGSLCELGLFTSSEEFGHKLLILASNEFARTGSYIADGPLTIAEHHRAQVCYVDYADFEAAWALVRARIQQLKVVRSLEKLTARSHRR